MVVKELIEARWKAITCGLLALVLVEASAATYDLLRPVLSNTSSSQMPQFLQQQVQQLTSSYSLYVWGNWFAKNGTEILALLFSVLFRDVLRPLLCTLVITILAIIPGFFPNWGTWSLPDYWSSQAAYLGQSFPTKELIICLVAAALPLFLALILFRRQAY